MRKHDANLWPPRTFAHMCTYTLGWMHGYKHNGTHSPNYPGDYTKPKLNINSR